jgi:uncharacterized protein YjbJ (UPF0337 family)
VKKDHLMSWTTDHIKGRAKAAAGALLGNHRLARQGRMDQTIGEVKATVERLIGKAKSTRRSP